MEWLASKTEGGHFAACRTLNKRSKDKLVAFCTVLSLNIGVRGISADQETLIDQLDVGFAAYWQPTQENHLSRRTNGQLLAQFGPVFGQAWLGWHSDAKKGAIGESFDERFQEKSEDENNPRVAWVPEQF